MFIYKNPDTYHKKLKSAVIPGPVPEYLFLMP